MSDFLNTFGLDWAKFISQVIVVLIVYAILAKFAFGPVLAMLEQRRKRIEDGEANLVKIREQLATAEEKVQSMLDEANRDAERLISEARESADALRDQKSQEAIKEAQQIIEKARAAAKVEHDNLMSSLKQEFGRLVTDATSKVTGKVLDEEDQKRINQETAGQVAL